MSSKIYIALILITAVLGCRSDQSSTNSKSTSKSDNPNTTVEGIIVDTKSITNKINVNGNIIANEDIEIKPEIAGRLVSVNFKEGQYVNKGRLLAKLNDADLRAELKKAEVAYELAEQDESRKKQLLDIKAIAAEEYDQAATQLKSAEADIELLKAQIDKTEIRAPFSGVVGLRYISSGAFVSSGQVIAELQQNNPMKLDFSIPERYSSKVSTQTPVRFTVEGLRDTFEAKIYAIDPVIDLNNRTFRVRARVDNKNGIFKRGAFATIEIILENISDAIMVPASALVPEIRGYKVLLLKDQKVHYKLVKTGIRTDSEIEITEGLEPGDTLITSGLIQLKEGTPAILESDAQ